MKRFLTLGRTLAAALALTAAMPVVAQTAAAPWPTKPVRMVIPIGPGSAPDIIARIVGEKLGVMWGQSVIVDNRPGASGMLAMDNVRASAADGYSLVFANGSAVVVTPYTFLSAKYDAERDFDSIAVVAYTPMGIVANPDVPVASLADALRLAKESPGKFAVGNPGRTTFPHLAMELITQQTGANFLNVPFANSGPGLQATIKGDTAYYIDGVAPLLQMIRANRVKPIAIFADQVLPGLEGIPLAKDTVPGVTVLGWFAIMAPTGLPKAIAARINEDVNRVLAMPDVIAKLREFGTYPKPGNLAAASAFVHGEKTMWMRVLKQANIQPQ
jgi:tripartite-type tricarboxylate transporter receptor subunit TctC